MRNIFPLLVVVFLASCEDVKKGQPQQSTEQTTVTETITEKEPTTPEQTEYYSPKPPVVSINPETGIPSDAIILFDGSNFEQWVSTNDSTEVKWDLNSDGSMTVKDQTGNIQTKRNFGDIQLHVEWRSNPDSKGSNQSKSNSGIFLQGKYELQVLDNNDNDTYVNGQVGSIYKQTPPLVHAALPTGQWNRYDVVYHAPEFDSNGDKAKSGNITVFLNGVLIQDNTEIKGTTEYIGWPKNEAHGDGPLMLQDHGDKSGVSYRNIWVREL
ncbi:3-keto-disaccharide hydrolase [Aegicerativicinus sediminis]|uniref:3-keto-disaccharide hydrolase n=1 Tax=Aegicerativicinus sediminis TaxID=2893202 RepID=UPI001E373A9D|nr:DUF1080 domain-containing protein [Aegicerativicinus sediminis]